MGDFIKSAFGGGSAGSAGSRAGAVEAQGFDDAFASEQGFNQQAIDALRKAFATNADGLRDTIVRGDRSGKLANGGTTAEGLDARLAQLFNTDIFGTLSEERGRAAQGQLAAGGLTRSGAAMTEAARVPTELGLQLEQLLYGRQRDQATTGLNTRLSLGHDRLATAGSVGNIFQNTGIQSGNAIRGAAGSTANGIITDAQTRAAGSQNLLNTAATVAGFFSDPRLKANAEQVGRVADLAIYQWDWVPGAPEIVQQCSTLGFMATEVEEKYPHHVGEYGGYKVINYPALLDELETKWQH